jgi:hypothetical protein
MTAMQAPRQMSSRPLIGQPPPNGRRRQAVSRRTAFWLLARVLTFSVLLAALGLFSISRFVRGAQ